MYFARMNENGQMRIPAEIQDQLGLKPGDKVRFSENQNGEIILSNASARAIPEAQAAFADAAEVIGVSNEEDVQALVDEVRYGKRA